MKSKKITFLIYILIIVFIYFVTLFFTSGIITFFTNNFSVNIENIFENMFSKIVLIAGSSLSIVILVYLGYHFLKIHFSGRNMLAKNERSKSKLHDNTSFQNEKQMLENYGKKIKANRYDYFDFKNLKNDHFSGYVIKAKYHKQTIKFLGIQNQHMLLCSTTGAGKTTGILEPSIIANIKSKTKSSMIISDIKGDLYRRLNQVLIEEGYQVICLNMENPLNSSRNNFLSRVWDFYEIYIHTKEKYFYNKASQEINFISEMLIPARDEKNKFWDTGSQYIFQAILWALLEDSQKENSTITRKNFNFATIIRIASSTYGELINFLTKGRDPDSLPTRLASTLISAAESPATLGSLLATFKNSLKLFNESDIQYLTIENDFELKDILNKPTAVFMIVSPTDTSKHALVNIYVQQIYRTLIYEASLPNSKYADNKNTLYRPVYYLLDEFANFPKIDIFNTWLSTSRQYNIWFCAIIQDLSQLKEKYGEKNAQTLLANFNAKIYLRTTEDTTVQFFQNLFGNYTVNTRSLSTNQKTTLSFEGSTSLAKMPLVTDSELKSLKINNIIFRVGDQLPCRATIIPIYDKKAQDYNCFPKNNSIVINAIPEKEISDKIYVYKFRNFLKTEEHTSKNRNLESSVNESKKRKAFYEKDIILPRKSFEDNDFLMDIPEEFRKKNTIVQKDESQDVFEEISNEMDLFIKKNKGD